MKFFMLVIGGCMIMSCKKSDTSPIDQKINLDAATRQVLASKSTNELRQAYSLLNDSEKQLLWEAKLNAILINDGSKLTLDQRSIVISLIDVLAKKTIAGLIKNPTEGDTYLKANLANFQKKINVSQLYMLIESPFFCDNFSIFQTEMYLNNLEKRNVPPLQVRVNLVDPGGSNCTCRYDLWCKRDPLYTTCDTNNNTCTTVSTCGVFGTSDCLGTCS